MIEIENVFTDLTSFKKDSFFHKTFSNSFYTAGIISLVVFLLAYVICIKKKKLQYPRFFIYSFVMVSLILIVQYKVLETNFKDECQILPEIGKNVEIKPEITGGDSAAESDEEILKELDKIDTSEVTVEEIADTKESN